MSEILGWYLWLLDKSSNCYPVPYKFNRFGIKSAFITLLYAVTYII